MLDAEKPKEQYLGGALIKSNWSIKIEYNYIPDKKVQQ